MESAVELRICRMARNLSYQEILWAFEEFDSERRTEESGVGLDVSLIPSSFSHSASFSQHHKSSDSRAGDVWFISITSIVSKLKFS